jgi:hypothetical protein
LLNNVGDFMGDQSEVGLALATAEEHVRPDGEARAPTVSTSAAASGS